MKDTDFRGNISMMDLCSPSHLCFEPICNISKIRSEYFKDNVLQLNCMPCMERHAIKPFFKNQRCIENPFYFNSNFVNLTSSNYMQVFIIATRNTALYT